MKREFNFIPEEGESPEIDFMPDFPNDESEECPYGDLMMALMFQSRPFGFMWTKDKIVEFLKARGYKILSRKNRDTGEEYDIAVKTESSSIPDSGESNIKEVFDSEMQDILIKWVLKIASEV